MERERRKILIYEITCSMMEIALSSLSSGDWKSWDFKLTQCLKYINCSL